MVWLCPSHPPVFPLQPMPTRTCHLQYHTFMYLYIPFHLICHPSALSSESPFIQQMFVCCLILTSIRYCFRHWQYNGK